MHRRNDRRHRHLDDRDERGNDQHVGRYPHLVRYESLERRHEKAGSGKHGQSGDTHRQAVRDRVGHGKCRAQAHCVTKDRILAPNAPKEVLTGGRTRPAANDAGVTAVRSPQDILGR